MALRRAEELRAEQETKEAADRNRSFQSGLGRATKLIENALKEGKNRVWDQTFSEDVIEHLRSMGYTVKFHPAAGMGDVDSHEISW